MCATSQHQGRPLIGCAKMLHGFQFLEIMRSSVVRVFSQPDIFREEKPLQIIIVTQNSRSSTFFVGRWCLFNPLKYSRTGDITYLSNSPLSIPVQNLNSMSRPHGDTKIWSQAWFGSSPAGGLLALECTHHLNQQRLFSYVKFNFLETS